MWKMEKNISGIERPLRIAAGAALLRSSMKGHSKGDLKSWAVGLLGTQLVWSGLSGYDIWSNFMGRDKYHAA